ncbi:MAG: hypothetical protein V7785_01700 [Bermanella sp.]
MMLASKKSILPFGAVTLTLLAAALLFQFWPKSSCDKLKEKMEAGYFLRWMPPQLMLITADKKTLMVSADDESLACEVMMLELGK